MCTCLYTIFKKKNFSTFYSSISLLYGIRAQARKSRKRSFSFLTFIFQIEDQNRPSLSTSKSSLIRVEQLQQTQEVNRVVVAIILQPSTSHHRRPCKLIAKSRSCSRLRIFTNFSQASHYLQTNSIALLQALATSTLLVFLGHVDLSRFMSLRSPCAGEISPSSSHY